MILEWRTAGQVCTHANRVYVHRSVYEKFAPMIVAATKQIRVGHGAKEGTTMGSLTTFQGITKLERHIKDATNKGATILCGGQRVADVAGYFFQPTILSNMNSTMMTSEEEIFGPFLGLYSFDTEDEAVQMANHTSWV